MHESLPKIHFTGVEIAYVGQSDLDFIGEFLRDSYLNSITEIWNLSPTCHQLKVTKITLYHVS